jgi:eukaryotic-like serine/threonine-protein kinase
MEKPSLLTATAATVKNGNGMQLPQRFGKYELTEHLGGGMSHVFRARDTILNRIVAVKVLSEKANQDKDSRARFLEEARTASRVSHENIISVYDYGEETSRPFMVMEFLTGESLREAMKHDRVGDLRMRLNIALQIARAIAYIHSQRIIHRDIKPENLNLAPNGKIKLMDFGIAKSEGASLTRAGFILGTPFYMAPEQVTGKPLTPLVDVYAFGVMLFELLTNEKAVSGNSIDQIFRQIINAPLPKEVLVDKGIPMPLTQLIERCVAKNPGHRWQSFDQLAFELERIMVSLHATVPAPDLPPNPDSLVPLWVRQLPDWIQSPARLTVALSIFVFLIAMLMYLIARFGISLAA